MRTYANLRGRRGLLRLQVVAVEVALEVEVREHLLRLHAEERLQLRIGLDGVLVLQLVRLHVGRDRLRHVGAALQGAVGAAEEAAELVGERGGELEDGRLAGLHLLTLHGLLGAAAALVGLLLEAGHALLQALELGHEGADRLAHRVGLGEHGLHVILYGHHGGLRGLHGGGRHGRRRGRRRGGYSGCSHGYLLGRRRRLLGRRRGRRHSHGGRRSHRGRRLLSLLGHLLGRLGRRGGRAHYTGCRGSIHG